MTSHAVADEKYTHEFATIRDAYRVGAGNSTLRAVCEGQVSGAALRSDAVAASLGGGRAEPADGKRGGRPRQAGGGAS